MNINWKLGHNFSISNIYCIDEGFNLRQLVELIDENKNVI